MAWDRSTRRTMVIACKWFGPYFTLTYAMNEKLSIHLNDKNYTETKHLNCFPLKKSKTKTKNTLSCIPKNQEGKKKMRFEIYPLNQSKFPTHIFFFPMHSSFCPKRSSFLLWSPRVSCPPNSLCSSNPLYFLFFSAHQPSSFCWFINGILTRQQGSWRQGLCLCLPVPVFRAGNHSICSHLSHVPSWGVSSEGGF